MNTYKVVKKDYNWQQLVLGKMQLNINAKRSMSFLSGAQKKRGVQLVPYCTWEYAVESNSKYSILLGGTKKAIQTGAVGLPRH